VHVPLRKSDVLGAVATILCQRESWPIWLAGTNLRSNSLTKEEMKNCAWLKPELVAQIEFTEWTPDGHLRHSKFVGLREDKDAREVVRESEKNVADLKSV
jgi:ATP-dependent DNA ligase